MVLGRRCAPPCWQSAPGLRGEKQLSPDRRYHSAYRFALEAKSSLHLWGWGIWIAEEGAGSLFIRRAQFRTQYSTRAILHPQAWCERDLPLTDAPAVGNADRSAHYLLARAARWIGAYEAWLRQVVDAGYRDSLLLDWPQRKRFKGGVAAAEMAERWFEIADHIEKGQSEL